ncbi:Ligand-gated ion channel 50 [Aphelenchoides fujianensis]|nr:Ligand-gated ion channel 50 [Aphelenchoides fujianensis]
MVVQSLLLNLAQVITLVNSTVPPAPTTAHPLQHTANAPSTQRKNCTSQDILTQSTTIVRTVLGGDYDKHLAPDANGVTVSIELAVQTFYDVSEMSASFTADVLMSQIWEDRRLRYDQHTSCLENLTLSAAIIDKLWLPFVCFVNSKRSDLHTSPTPNSFILLYPNGTVWVNYRLRVEGPCYVNLGNYPFNGEECELILESYAYNQGTVKLKWRDWSPVIEYPSRTKPPDFQLSKITWRKASFVYAAGQWDQASRALLCSTYSRSVQLSVSFFLTRDVGVYILTMFVPTFISIGMSWISFWLDHHALPARITLGVSSLMSISIQYSSIVRTLPRVSYYMSIDFWMASAILFIGATLVELTLVGYLDRADRAKRRRAAMGEMVDEAFTEEVKSYGTFLHKFSGEQNGDHRLNFGEMGEKRRLSQRTPSAQLNYRIFQARFLYKQMQQNWRDPEYIDEKARFYFPAAFIVFNCLFWFFVIYRRWQEHSFRNDS